MEFQNERIKKALRGQGAFYTYVYIACPTADALSVAQAVAKSTWQNEFAMTNPIQVLNLTESEQRHLLYHFAAFSADVTREDVFGTEEYKYCTVLLPEEYPLTTNLRRRCICYGTGYSKICSTFWHEGRYLYGSNPECRALYLRTWIPDCV